CGFVSASRAGLRVLAVGPRRPLHDAADAADIQPVDLWVASLADPDLVKWADTRRP
ncbi:HAD family phosphatase, partial [Streptomyces sp. MCAF7]